MTKKIFTLFILSFIVVQSKAQLVSDVSFLTGKNYASFGMYQKVAEQLAYNYEKWTLSASAGLVFSNNRSNKLDAYKIELSRTFSIHENVFNANIFYQKTPFSARIHEYNTGILFNHKVKKWDFNLGANSRVFKIPNKYAKAHAYKKTKIWQVFNILYKVTYQVPLIDKKLNLNASITNYDLFTLAQETNPFFMLDFDYKMTNHSKLYLDLAYMQAGLFNIRVNYFGYFAKIGYQVDLDFKSKKKND